MVQIAAGSYVHYGLAAEGRVWAWGHDQYGALGDGRDQWGYRGPVQVSNLTEVIKVEGGTKFGVALKRDGTGVGLGFRAIWKVGNGWNR